MSKLKTLLNFLREKKLTLASAESCSGGFASCLLTAIAHSSKVFKGAVVAYSPEAKHKLLDIPLSCLKKCHGVSKDIAASLAYKVRKKLDANIGLSIVGFAGPSAPKGKRGTVFLGISDSNSIISLKAHIKGSRDTIRKKASFLLLELLDKHLNKSL